MTDERIWDHASIGERVDFLKVRLDRMDRAFNADRQKIEALLKANEVLVGRNCDLARRVAEIEGTSRLPKGWTRDMVEEFNRWKPSEEVREALSGLGPDMIEVPASELARLRRIEEQLKALRKALMWNGSVSAAAWITDIDATLDSEPKR